MGLPQAGAPPEVPLPHAVLARAGPRGHPHAEAYGWMQGERTLSDSKEIKRNAALDSQGMGIGTQSFILSSSTRSLTVAIGRQCHVRSSLFDVPHLHAITLPCHSMHAIAPLHLMFAYLRLIDICLLGSHTVKKWQRLSPIKRTSKRR